MRTVIADGDSVTPEHAGRLTDGTVFDTSRAPVAEGARLAETSPDREYTPLTVEVGGGRVVEGTEEGPAGPEVGETTTLTISQRAYGERDAGVRG